MSAKNLRWLQLFTGWRLAKVVQKHLRFCPLDHLIIVRAIVCADATSGSSRKHTTNDGCCSFFVCRKNLFFRFSSSFASLGLVCSLSTAFMTFYRFNSYRSDVAWMCVPGNTFTSRKFPDLYLLMPLSNFFSTTLDDTTCCFISAR